jgi:hypothetical protein
VLFLAASSQRPLVVKTSFLVDIEEREASIYGVAQRRSTRAGIDPSPHQARRPLLGQADRLNAIGNEPWSVGEWRCTLQGQNGPVLVSGYWSAIYVREGDDWKFQMLNYNVTPIRWHPFIDNRTKQLALLSLSLPNCPHPYSG